MREGGITWGRVSRGLYLIGFGTILFLNTQDILPWTFWREALVYWPVGLVALGIRLLFERTRAPWMILLGPFLVLGILTWVSLRPTPMLQHSWGALDAARPEDAKSWSLAARMAMVSLDMEARDLPKGKLVEGRGSPPGRSEVRVTRRRGSPRVRVGARHGTWKMFTLPGFPRRMELGVTRDLPVAVELDLAFVEGTIDLAAAPVSRFEMDGAFNDLKLTLGAPASDVRLEFDGAFTRVTLLVPPETPVHVDADGFLNFVHGRAGEGSLRGPGYHLDLDGAFNSLTVRSR